MLLENRDLRLGFFLFWFKVKKEWLISQKIYVKLSNYMTFPKQICLSFYKKPKFAFLYGNCLKKV